MKETDKSRLTRKEIYSIARGIAGRLNSDCSDGLYSELMEASEIIGLDFDEIENRYQYWIPGDRNRYHAYEIHYLLTGIPRFID